MSEVRSLKVAPRSVNEDVVGLLEDALLRARCGETVSIGLVEVHPAGTVSFATVDSGHYHNLNSGAARLAAYLASAKD